MIISKTEPSISHAPGTITLLSNDTVHRLNRKLERVYDELSELHFLAASESDLRSRIRKYDNNQRFTFGRGQSKLMLCKDILNSFDLDQVDRLYYGSPDASYFPGHLADAVYSPLAEVLQYSISTLLQGHEHDQEPVLVTLFMHRTLVRPGESYKGFFHLDLAPRKGRIGTMIWYPTIRHWLMEGGDFIAYTASQDEPLDLVRAKEPDYRFANCEYHQNALVLGYPHNYPHGVLPGVNTARCAADREAILRDFISPTPNCYIKDLVIVTVSEYSPVEH